MTRCTGENQQYTDMQDCLDYHGNMNRVEDTCPLLSGFTTACHWTHTYLAHEALRPDIHCFHAGKMVPDPNGDLKCSWDQCSENPAVCENDDARAVQLMSGSLNNFNDCDGAYRWADLNGMTC